MTARTPKPRPAGFSMVEIVTAVAILGIIASVGIGAYGKFTIATKVNVATNLTETLNQATRKFSHANWDLYLAPNAGSTVEEFRILRTLQWRDDSTDELTPKGPFMRPDWDPAASDEEGDFRIQWTGNLWKLLRPGDTGAGLKVTFDGGSDLKASNYAFPENFAPVGP